MNGLMLSKGDYFVKVNEAISKSLGLRNLVKKKKSKAES
jgi:hypothetical protein